MQKYAKVGKLKMHITITYIKNNTHDLLLLLMVMMIHAIHVSVNISAMNLVQTNYF